MVIALGDKANAWSFYVKRLAPEQADLHIFIDGDVEVSEGAFDEIRKLFAKAPMALQRGYTAGTFSFNSGDGRCPTCGGSGFEHVEMQFLSDLWLTCEECDGSRYAPEILEVRYRGRSIADVLAMSVEEALAFFEASPEIARILQT
ncbi:MAG: hypothetical protein AAFV01_17905, partial [Bacteroidota bacterium]